MKFKYYLRGAGVGMIVTAIILMIAFSRLKPGLSKDKIIEEAKKYGMIMPEDNTNNADNTGENADGQSEDNKDDSDSGSDNAGDDNSGDDNDTGSGDDGNDGDNSDGGNTGDNTDEGDDNPEDDEYVVFVIRGGEFSDVISNHLFEKGLIDDAEKYNEWLMANHLDEDLQPGTYTLKKGMSYWEIAKILSTRTD